MAPVLSQSSPLIVVTVSIAGVQVKALIDTGATASCCRWGWYKRWKAHLGPLVETDKTVVGVGNDPIKAKGLTDVVELEWDDVVGPCQLVILTTLQEVDVILGMDVLMRFGVEIEASEGRAWPGLPKRSKQIPRSSLESPSDKAMVLGVNVKIPAGKSRVFFMDNELEGLVLFEPGLELPEGLQGIPSLGTGKKIAVQLDNHSEKDIVLNPQWTLGRAYAVQLVVKEPPAARKQLPEVPSTLTDEQQQQLKDLLLKYQDVFSQKGDPISSTPYAQHEIHTEGPPVRLPSRRQNPLIREQEQQQVQDMLREGVIRPSVSPWASPVVMVRKKDNSMRFCVDFRKVNDATIKDAHPLPRIDDTLESLHGAKYFSTLDLKSGYWQGPIKEQHKEKTAFRTSGGQLYEFNQLPFGLCNAPATFSRLMDRTLAGLAWNICLYYLDDIIVFSRTWQEHLHRLEVVFKRLREANLKLGSAKCNLAKEEVNFLGYRVTRDGLEPDLRLLGAISQIEPPRDVRGVRSFLGLIGYYRRFVKKFSDKAAPLTKLLRKDQEWEWSSQCQEAFELLKEELTKRPVTAFPDFSKPFRLYTDASNLGLGAILSQKQEGKERIICCASRTLTPSEVNYSTTKKECLALVWGIGTFRSFLVATHFEVVTDHYSLQWLRSMKNESALLHRWAAMLEDFRFSVLYRPGQRQGHVDGLSRLPITETLFTLEGKIRLNGSEAEAAIKAVHKEGHMGVKKTWKAFNRRYVTDFGRKRCGEVVRTCPECQIGKDVQPRTHMPRGAIESSRPWDILSIDVVGPVPYDNHQRRFIITIMDVYSRYFIAVPTKDHTAQTVARCLYEQVIAYFGVPRSILSDRGSEFTGLVYQSLAHLLGTEVRLTSPYYPQGNGIIERSHRTMNNMLRTLLLEKKERGWSTLLPSVMLYMNTMVQEHSNYSACEILFGKNPNLPSDISFTPSLPIQEDRDGYVKQLKRELGDIRASINQHLGRQKNMLENPFKVGEQILVRLQPLELGNKFEGRWKGPFTVVNIPNKFQVEYKEEGRKKISHISYVKKFYARRSYVNKVKGTGGSDRVDSRRGPFEVMAGLRVSFGAGKRERCRNRILIFSLEKLRSYISGLDDLLTLQVTQRGQDLSPELKRILEKCDDRGRVLVRVIRDLCGVRSSPEGGKCGAPLDLLEEDLRLTDSDSEVSSEKRKGRRKYLKYVRKNDILKASFSNTQTTCSFLQEVVVPAKAVEAPVLTEVVDRIKRKQRPPSKYFKNTYFCGKSPGNISPSISNYRASASQTSDLANRRSQNRPKSHLEIGNIYGQHAVYGFRLG